MISSHITHRMALERIDDLRREADRQRQVKLARTQRSAAPTAQPESPLRSNHRPQPAVPTLDTNQVS
jgi:hypothetical protein